MSTEKFNVELFKEVVQSNIDRTLNSIMIAAERKAAMTGNPIISEMETRQMARDFFNKQLAKELFERL